MIVLSHPAPILYHADAGYTLNAFGENGACSSNPRSGNRLKPSTVTISQNGQWIAFAESKVGSTCGERIVLIRHNIRVTISGPGRSARRPADGHNASISNLDVTDDGTLFATVSDAFSGAYSGVRREAYVRRTGSIWRNVPKPTEASSTSNVSVDSAISSSDYYVNIDQDADLPSVIRYVQVEHHVDYHRPTAFRTKSWDSRSLGFGTVLSQRLNYAVGYSDAYKHVDVMSPKAIRWTNGARHVLGTGIAYDVDDSGQVVGDDRQAWDAFAHPAIWDGGHLHILLSHEGSALAVRGHLIGGTASGSAFLAFQRDSHFAVRFVRSIRAGSIDARIISAFFIDHAGSVFFLGEVGTSYGKAAVVVKAKASQA